MQKNDFVTRFKVRFLESLIYLYGLSPFGHIPERKFVVLSLPRTGSTLLRTLINFHPDIHCDDEIFLIVNNINLIWSNQNILLPNLYLRALSKRQPQSIYGFHLKLYQLIRHPRLDPEQFLLSLSKRNYKIIYLERKNVLKIAISAIVADKRKMWHRRTSEEKTNRPKIVIDCSNLLFRIENFQSQIDAEKKIIENIPYLPIVYEEDLLLQSNHQQTANKIFDYLGVDSVPVQTKLYRTSSDNLADTIENYDEVYECIKNTKYAHFLE